MTREPVLPTVRAAVFTAVCLGLAVAAHRVMSQAAIPAWALALGGVGVYVPARLGSRRERGLLEIALLMGVLQVALHALFACGQDMASSSVHMPMTMPMPAGTSMPGMPVSALGADAGMRMSAGMLIGHALAALACAWWLRRGEAALHTVARTVAHWVVALLVASAPAAYIPAFRPNAVRRVEPVALALRSQWLHSSRVLRGPPMAPSFT